MRNVRLKKALCTLLSIMLTCMAPATTYAHAGFDVKAETECSPRYIELGSIVTTLSIDNRGTSTCSSKVTTHHPRTSITIKMELQQKQSSTWNTIQTWTKADTTPSFFEKRYVVKSGYDYRLRVTATVYDESGNMIEQGTKCSTIVHF